MPQNKPTIKLALAQRSATGVRDYAQRVHDGLDGNVLYILTSDTIPPLITFQGNITALTAAIGARGDIHTHGSTLDTANLVTARDVVEVNMTQLAGFSQGKTPYDEAAFLSANWEVKNPKGPSSVLPAPADLREMHDDNIPSGSIRLRCNPVTNARIYIFIRQPVTPETLPVEYQSDKSFITIDGLTPGLLYEFNVLAFGAKGRGVVSDVCEARAL